MAKGFRQRDPAGNLLVDVTTRLPRIIGRVTLSPGVSGSVYVPTSGNNPIFYYYAGSNVPGREAGSPNITVNDGANTISWTYPGSAYYAAGTLAYGRY
ncbi:hypothetical protein [Stenotrophomonas indicatrix]|jgi:hypothetical protein|uniref:hypothetical protein n=1 Tax=Stenotrophomonas indicatrix TaxID=2045451 RepID=UPI00073965AA|nr:hypothetical protein [Stenotrophomonas indicatrix]MCK6229443.1 hypothetical protein [Stenotrophomonas indicatrix]CRD49584.1 conserved hypothetical protein [Stenotrophomonas indicatrix]